MTPQQLADAAQRGDQDAFAQLWQMYRPEVYRVVYYRTRNHHTAEDLTSETFLRAWKGIGSFTWQGKGFGGWVITIARNITLDHHNSAHHRRTSLHDEFYDADTDRRADPEQVAQAADLAVALDEAIAELSADQRQVIALRFGAGQSLADTARAMDRKIGAVKAVQHRATLALRQHPAVTALEVAA